MTPKAMLAALSLSIVVSSTALAGETEQKYGFDPDSFEVKFYMQPRYTVDLSGDDGTNDSSFRVRRGRVYMTSKVSPNIKGRVQINVTPEKTGVEDVYFEWGIPLEDKKPLKLTFGQFKKAFSYQEFEMSSSNLNLIDRSASNSFLEKTLYASARDQGVMLSADLAEYDTPVTLYAGIFNGNGKGTKEDDNSGKQFVARAATVPATGLSLGGNVGFNRVGPDGSAETFAVWGVDGAYEKSGFMVVTELFGGENFDEPAGTTGEVPDFLSGYAELIYRDASGWEPAARFEAFDPNTDVDDDGVIILTGQIARTFTDNFRWQVNVVHNEFSADGVDAETELVSQWTVRL